MWQDVLLHLRSALILTPAGAQASGASTPVARPPRVTRCALPGVNLALHVRIDHLTQGPEGAEEPADRLNVDSTRDTWFYVEAELPDGAAPAGHYAQLTDGQPGAYSPLDAPTRVGDAWRFRLLHYYLLSGTHYTFHFADDLSAPAHEDRWEVDTVSEENEPTRLKR